MRRGDERRGELHRASESKHQLCRSVGLFAERPCARAERLSAKAEARRSGRIGTGTSKGRGRGRAEASEVDRSSSDRRRYCDGAHVTASSRGCATSSPNVFKHKRKRSKCYTSTSAVAVQPSESGKDARQRSEAVVL